jgi:peptidoglycan/LPS O-acetylase OafA/YrhL
MASTSPAPVPRKASGAGLRELAAATPAGRVRSVDLLRAVALVLVVLGHWLAVVVTSDPAGTSRLGGSNLLALWPPSHVLTWAFQVVPLLFLTGGFGNAASWRSARGSSPAHAWLGSRLRRLLHPTLVLVTAVAAVAAVAVGAGADRETVRLAAWLAGIPLWFLVVYTLTVLATPVVVAAVDRWGWAAPAVLAGLAAGVDVLHVHLGVAAVGQANYLLVWGAAYATGVRWQAATGPREQAATGGAGAAPRADLIRVAGWIAAGGFAGAVAAVAFGPYPVSLLLSPGSAVQNSAPPSVALLLYAAGQCGLAIRLSGWLERLAERRRVWFAVVAVNSAAMSLFLWHLVPVVLVALGVQALRLADALTPLSAQWWATRPAWLLACAAVLVPVLAVVRPLERPRRRSAAGDPDRTAGHRRIRLAVLTAGTVGAAAGIMRLTVDGMSDGGPWGLPLAGLALLAAGLAAVHAVS